MRCCSVPLTFVSFGSDLGLTGSLGYFWRQRYLGRNVRFDELVTAIRRLRLVLLVGCATVAGVMLLKAAKAQNVALATIAICFVLFVLTAWLQMRVTIDLLLVRIEDKFRESYYCEGAGSVTRLAMALLMMGTGITAAWFGLLGGLLGVFVTFAALHGFLNVPGKRVAVRRDTWRSLVVFVGPTLPSMLVHMVSDPLIAWIAFTTGGQAPFSEAFAVNRIAALYGVVGTFIITVVAARLLRIQDAARFAKMAGLVILALLVMCSAVLAVAYFMPWAFLLIIGPRFEHLDIQVFWSLLASSCGLLALFGVVVNRTLGWVKLEPLTAAIQIAAICLLVPGWSLTDSVGILKLGAVLSVVVLACILGTTVIGVTAPRLVQVAYRQ